MSVKLILKHLYIYLLLYSGWNLVESANPAAKNYSTQHSKLNLITIDVSKKSSDDYYTYTRNTVDDTDEFNAKDTFVFNKITNAGDFVWEAQKNDFAKKIILRKDANGDPKLTLFYYQPLKVTTTESTKQKNEAAAEHFQPGSLLEGMGSPLLPGLHTNEGASIPVHHTKISGVSTPVVTVSSPVVVIPKTKDHRGVTVSDHRRRKDYVSFTVTDNEGSPTEESHRYSRSRSKNYEYSPGESEVEIVEEFVSSDDPHLKRRDHSMSFPRHKDSYHSSQRYPRDRSFRSHDRQPFDTHDKYRYQKPHRTDDRYSYHNQSRGPQDKRHDPSYKPQMQQEVHSHQKHEEPSEFDINNKQKEEMKQTENVPAPGHQDPTVAPTHHETGKLENKVLKELFDLIKGLKFEVDIIKDKLNVKDEIEMAKLKATTPADAAHPATAVPKTSTVPTLIKEFNASGDSSTIKMYSVGPEDGALDIDGSQYGNKIVLTVGDHSNVYILDGNSNTMTVSTPRHKTEDEDAETDDEIMVEETYSKQSVPGAVGHLRGTIPPHSNVYVGGLGVTPTSLPNLKHTPMKTTTSDEMKRELPTEQKEAAADKTLTPEAAQMEQTQQPPAQAQPADQPQTGTPTGAPTGPAGTPTGAPTGPAAQAAPAGPAPAGTARATPQTPTATAVPKQQQERATDVTQFGPPAPATPATPATPPPPPEPTSVAVPKTSVTQPPQPEAAEETEKPPEGVVRQTPSRAPAYGIPTFPATAPVQPATPAQPPAGTTTPPPAPTPPVPATPVQTATAPQPVPAATPAESMTIPPPGGAQGPVPGAMPAAVAATPAQPAFDNVNIVE